MMDTPPSASPRNSAEILEEPPQPPLTTDGAIAALRNIDRAEGPESESTPLAIDKDEKAEPNLPGAAQDCTPPAAPQEAAMDFYSMSSRSSYSADCSSNPSSAFRSPSKGGNTRRSMELRKVAMDNALLFGSSSQSNRSKCFDSSRNDAVMPEETDWDNSDSAQVEEENPKHGICRKGSGNGSKYYITGSFAQRILRSTCLRSNFSLQSQLLLSFGLVSLLTILLVMGVCVAVSILSGNKVNDLTRDSLEELSYQMEGKIVRYVAETLSMRLLPNAVLQQLHNAVVDRFIGYPDYPGYENDTLTPFLDVYTKQRIYPVKGPAARMDWDLQNVVTPETAEEHVGVRYPLYQNYKNVTTSHGVYSFQGSCNPAAAFGSYDWYPNCTAANNNITTGGVVRPVPTNEGLHARASDLTPLFKAIFEENGLARDVGIGFANGGAGSSFHFPGYTVEGTQSYKSSGCEWMRAPNPYKPSQPIGTEDMIAKCHPKGEIVYNREYNPLEQEWCKQQALNPNSTHFIGPYMDAWSNDVQLIMAGQAVYDPLTKELIGCLYMDVTLTKMQTTLKSTTVTPNSHVSIVLWDPTGTLAASSAFNGNESKHDDTKIQELSVGVHPDVYQKLYTLVDYKEPWDPQEVRETYTSTIHHDVDQGYLVAAYPMPPVPREYDPNYRPGWLVIMSVATKDVLQQAAELEAYVDNKVERVVYFSLIVGIVGWGLVMLVIMVVSQALTLPLKTVNQATKDIVDNFGGNSEKGIEYNAHANPVLTKWAPKTEISQVVTEFKKMVEKFSGSSKMARSVQERFNELSNHFSFEHEFAELYKSRQEGSFAYVYDKFQFAPSATSKVPRGRRGPSRVLRRKQSHLIHTGTILTGSQSYLTVQNNKKCQRLPDANQVDSKVNRLTSPLFLWVVFFIVTPLLITTVTMSAIVTFNVSKELTEVIEDGKTEYVKLEKFALTAAVALRASWISFITDKTIRDLHVVSRYAGWLLFGGLERRDSFTQLTSGAEECKKESHPLECQYFEESRCACFMHPENGTCDEGIQSTAGYSSRYSQETYFLGQSQDAMADGDRKEALSFPEFAFSPDSTAWWSNATTVPGFEKGSNAEGYDTTYDRLRALSAIPVFQSLYNYNIISRGIVQTAVAMEADGMVVGYHGCSMFGEATAAFWESTPDNHANDIRPELCPIGKFGFDPRCREWYDTGKMLAEKNDTSLYFAAPYMFALQNIFGQTVTSAIVDPHTGEHVGQAFVDYISSPIFDLLSPNNTVLAGGFPILFTAHNDENGANTVIGPGYTIGIDQPISIEELIAGNDLMCAEKECQRTNQGFHTVLDKMMSGQIGTAQFSMQYGDGSDELMFVAYAPVNVTACPAIDSSDFSRGCSMERHTIYYLGLTEAEATLIAAFDQIAEDINNTIDIGIGIMSTAIVLATAVVIYISYWVAISITQPMLYLLELIRQINELDANNEILVDLDMQAGSLEVKSVANTMRTLHKIVHCANSAYFAGDIHKAYAVLTDSARLFKRLDNKKAVGVANNNLGNTMLAMYRAMRANAVAQECDAEEEKRYYGLTRKDIALKGIQYFQQAITLGEKAYDDFYEAEGWSPSCLDFMQHLANRYFNRAMFLLTVKDDYDNPRELEDMGMRDLQIARDMDVEIVDQGTEVGWQVNGADKLYNVALNRARGHLLLLEMGYPDEWDSEELLEGLFRTLKKELETKLHTSDLFHDLSPVGRMQQVETELMRYKILKGDLETASRIAIRMLMEDECILPEAQLKAVQVLLVVLKQSQPQVHISGQLKHYESWLQREKERCDNNFASSESFNTQDVSDVIMMSVAKMNMSLSAMDVSPRTLPKQSSLLATTRGDVTMECF